MLNAISKITQLVCKMDWEKGEIRGRELYSSKVEK